MRIDVPNTHRCFGKNRAYPKRRSKEVFTMHQVIFYPVGNGDTSQIILENGKRILLDYRHLAKSENNEGCEINLKTRLNNELKAASKKSFDIVAFTHGDSDHLGGSTDFFELEHSQKYKGGTRVPIPELWVPASMILEVGTKFNQTSEFILWRQEARYRLREGYGIRVFSKPSKLKSWLEKEGIKLEDRRSLITDAGQIVPGFDLNKDGVEFFCHSPFIKHVDDGDDMRNPCALIFNVRFQVDNKTFDFLAIGDSEWEVLEDIVKITSEHNNEDRLEWDLYNIPHHCSYKALSNEKGDEMTTPKPLVEDLLRKGRKNAYIVSSSKPIDDSKEAYTVIQPPHIQARRCYEKYLKEVHGAKFLVTMEEPNSEKPEPIIFEIAKDGISRKKATSSGAAKIVSNFAPRAG
jgi:hypothetical protein